MSIYIQYYNCNIKHQRTFYFNFNFIYSDLDVNLRLTYEVILHFLHVLFRSTIEKYKNNQRRMAEKALFFFNSNLLVYSVELSPVKLCETKKKYLYYFSIWSNSSIILYTITIQIYNYNHRIVTVTFYQQVWLWPIE